MDKMNNFQLTEMKQLTVKERFTDLCTYNLPVDDLTEDFPDDIDLWKMEYELVEFNSNETYRFWTKFIHITGEDEEGNIWSDFILNGYLQTIKNEYD